MWNRTLQGIDVSDNDIADAGLQQLACVLRDHNQTLRHLTLDNNFQEPGAGDRFSCLASALSANSGLESLSLVGCCVGTSGCEALASALCTNTALRSLELMGNSIGDCEALARSLRYNSTLTHLGLQRNSILESGARALADALSPAASSLHPWASAPDVGVTVSACNSSLIHLALGGNGFESVSFCTRRPVSCDRVMTLGRLIPVPCQRCFGKHQD